MLAEFAKIRVGPNQRFDSSRFSDEQRKIILSAKDQALKEIRSGSPSSAQVREGWMYPPSNLGNYGKDYMFRSVVALIGLAALAPAEAVYLTARTDKEGRPLRGENHYRLHFEKGELPPVDAFWSISMYEVMQDQRAFLVDNPIHRYAIGDRTKGQKFNSDGSLDIYIQNQSPGKELQSNWLPAPPGLFRVTFRAYQPREAILSGKYSLPGIRRVD